VLFEASDTFKGSYDVEAQKKLSETMDKKIASKLLLKVGAQVVLLRNLSEKLANGSRGVVVSLDSPAHTTVPTATVRLLEPLIGPLHTRPIALESSGTH
jgi:hypothetical protein